MQMVKKSILFYELAHDFILMSEMLAMLQVGACCKVAV